MPRSIFQLRSHIVSLVRYRELLLILAISDFKTRHRQTILGILWTLVQPVSMMLVATLIFAVFVKVPVTGMPYLLFAYTGILSWVFFANSLSNGFPSIVGNMNLVTKVKFPREVIPLAKILVACFDFLIGIAVLIILMFAYGVNITRAVMLTPFILMIHVFLTVGFVFWGSAAYVLKRDLGSLLPVVLQLWMFLSPVMYPAAVIPAEYQKIYFLNPIAAVIEAYRSILFLGVPPSLGLILPAFSISTLVLLSGFIYFKSVEPRFADVM